MTRFQIIYGLNANNIDGGVEWMLSFKVRLRYIGKGDQFIRFSIFGLVIGIRTPYNWQYTKPYKLFYKLHR